MPRCFLIWPVALVWVCLLGCGGGRSVYVTQFPEWNFENYKRVAVLPAKTTDRAALRECTVVSEQLTSRLSRSGAFEVLSILDLKDVLDAQDFSTLTDVDPNTQIPQGRIRMAQALIIPTITSYRLIREQINQPISRPLTDPYGRVLVDRFGRPLLQTVFVPMYRHGVVLDGGVRIVDAANGQTLFSWSLPEPITDDEKREGRPPSESAEEMAANAAREMAAAFFRVIAPTRVEVDLKEKDLLVATEYFDGRYYGDGNRLPIGIDNFLLVIRRLPAECERNRFRLAIAPGNGTRNLFEQVFVWRSGLGPEGYSVRVPMKSLIDAGGRRFVAKLYSGGPQPILTRSFELTPAKDERAAR